MSFDVFSLYKVCKDRVVFQLQTLTATFRFLLQEIYEFCFLFYTRFSAYINGLIVFAEK